MIVFTGPLCSTDRRKSAYKLSSFSYSVDRIDGLYFALSEISQLCKKYPFDLISARLVMKYKFIFHEQAYLLPPFHYPWESV